MLFGVTKKNEPIIRNNDMDVQKNTDPFTCFKRYIFELILINFT